LEIKPLSSFRDIQKNYKKLSKKYHSDISMDNEKMKDINEAYNVLKKYIENYKFTFSEEEITKQCPDEFIKKFRV